MRNIMNIAIIILLGVFSIAASTSKDIQVFGPSSADKIIVHSSDEDRVLISVLDADNNPIRGLQKQDFSILKGNRKGNILSATPLETAEEIPLNVVLVVDNSSSMETRNAVQPLLNALEEFYKVLRPIDNVHAIVFDDNNKNRIKVGDRALNIRTMQTNNVEELRAFLKESLENNISSKTYLYDGMYAGLDILEKMPAQSNKFLLVFTDGQDINSKTQYSEVTTAANDIQSFSAYTVDFTEETEESFYLKQFSENHGGRIWKASSSDELKPVFASFSNTLRHQYVISYRLLNPPTGTLALEPATVIIEEVTTIDSAPLLNYVFFEEGQSTIPNDYSLFSQQDMPRDFSEQALGSPMEKYRNILNIIGKRLSDNPGTSITILGCNSDQGTEKNNIDLSRNRAESVKAYLSNIWGIDSSRMEVKARNLPEVPSATSTMAGIAENRRVEIRSTDPAILDIVKSTYVQNMANTSNLMIKPNIVSEAGIDRWKVQLKGGDKTVIDSASGQGDIESAVTFNIVPAGLSKIASFKTLTASVEVTDKEGVAFMDENAAITNVKFIRKEAQSAERRGQKILEKYSLILFEYDKADIGERNRTVINRIVARIRELPDAKAKIVGYTDSIGTEEYNMLLSQRRAKAVYDQIMAAGMPSGKDITYTGVGLNQPLYDNAAPEGRALNRTVVVTLEYDEKI